MTGATGDQIYGWGIVLVIILLGSAATFARFACDKMAKSVEPAKDGDHRCYSCNRFNCTLHNCLCVDCVPVNMVELKCCPDCWEFYDPSEACKCKLPEVTK